MLDNIPSIIPTDNLYKFMSLSGMVLFFFCLFYPSWRVYNIERNEMEIKGKVSLLDGKIKIMTENVEEMKEYTREIEKSNMINDQRDKEKRSKGIEVRRIDDFSYQELADYFKNKEFRDAFGFVLDHKEQLYSNHNTEISENEERRKSVDALQLSLIEVNNLNALALFERKRADYVILLGLVGCMVSFIVSAAGFTLWYRNYQSVQDAILRKQLVS